MKPQGFTLVELSVVLFIISLLLAGIIGSQSLIGSAKAKDVIAIIEDIRAATILFKQRYKYLPGDWPYTANEIPNVTAEGVGGTIGDGVIDGAVDAEGQAEFGSEVAETPWQLFNAGFLGKIDNNEPRRRLRTGFGAVHIVSNATATGLVAGFAANPSVRNAILFFNLPCDIANEVDAKIDDGVITTGRAIGTACANDRVLWYAVAL